MSLFITGTDTDVGKTVISTLACLRWNAKYWKPVQSGLAAGTDSEFVSTYIGSEKVLPERYKLQEPLSPNHAAKIDGVQIDLDDFKMPEEENLVVEGAGGVLVPLNKKHTVLDLIDRFELPTLIVARSGLGTLNHTLMTVETLRSRDIYCAGIVLVGDPNTKNKITLQEFSGVEVIAEIPWMNSLDMTNLKKAAELLPATPPSNPAQRQGVL